MEKDPTTDMDILFLRELEKLIHLCVFLVGFVHLAVELGGAGTGRVRHQEALRLLHFGGLLRFDPAHSGSDVLAAVNAC